MKLGRDMIWNSAGTGLPMLVGVLVVPLIIKGLGTQKFGFLSIVWMLIGYFSILDLGIGRSVTKLAADCLAKHRDSEVAPLTATALIVVTASSALVSLALALSSGTIAQRVLHNAAWLRPEATSAILWLSLSLPFVLMTSVLTGVLEAYGKFALINAARLPLGVLMMVVPLAVLPFSKDLGVITAVLAAVRLCNTVVLLLIVLRTVPGLSRQFFRFRREILPPLMAFGGWLSVSNVVGPIMVYFDRFLIAALLGSTAVAYYTVPYDVLTRLWVVPTAIQGVLFPTFATLVRAEQPNRLVSIFERSSRTILLLMAPAVLGIMLLARQGLNIWVGTAIANQSTAVAKVLIAGVLVNAIARVPASLVQGAGYARWTAILHALELPAYGISLWILLSGGGIVGAAWAWAARMIVDTIALYIMAIRVERTLARTALRDLSLSFTLVLTAVLLSSMSFSVAARGFIVLLATLICGLMLLQHLHPVLPAAFKRLRLRRP